MKFTMNEKGEVIGQAPTSRPTATYRFNAREIATILHALRKMQDPNNCIRCCDHFEDVEALTDQQIDALCERLNPLDADKKPTEQEMAYIKRATELIEEGASFDDDDISINDAPDLNGNYPATSGVNEGSWVAAWVWVDKEDAGICRECGATNADNGEGFDGLCGECADKAEESGEEGFRDSGK